MLNLQFVCHHWLPQTLTVWLSCFYQVESAVQLLRGHVYEAMDNRSQAVHCYRAALLLDVRCFEAFDCLVQHHMMSTAEGNALLFMH